MTDPSSPGWYRDPLDPTSVHHWDGLSWTGRTRVWPAWDLTADDFVADPDFGKGSHSGGPTLEGPVQVAEISSSPRRSMVDQVRRSRLRSAASGDRVPPRDTAIARQRPLTSHDPIVGWTPRRRRMSVVVAIVSALMLSLAGLVFSVGTRGGSNANVLSADPSFVNDASSACETGLAALAAPAAATMSAPSDTAARAQAAQHTASVVASTGNHLRSLPVTIDAAVPVSAWLGLWSDYIGAERSLAGLLMSPGASPAGGTSIEQRIQSDAEQADQFAAANGLNACRLLASNTSVSVISIP